MDEQDIVKLMQDGPRWRPKPIRVFYVKEADDADDTDADASNSDKVSRQDVWPCKST